jgi:hypothetical protein
MPRTAVITTLIALALLAGTILAPHAPAPRPLEPASVTPLELRIPADLPNGTGDAEP